MTEIGGSVEGLIYRAQVADAANDLKYAFEFLHFFLFGRCETLTTLALFLFIFKLKLELRNTLCHFLKSSSLIVRQRFRHFTFVLREWYAFLAEFLKLNNVFKILHFEGFDRHS